MRKLIKLNFSSLFSFPLCNPKSTESARRKAEMSYRPATKDYAPANRDDFVAGRLSQSILLRRIAMHYKASRSCSATCIAKHFRSRRSPLTRLEEGAKRRAGWEGSKGKKGSLALDRLLHSAQVVPRPPFVLPVRRAFTYIFEVSSCLSPPHPSSICPPTSPLTRYFVSCSLFTLPSWQITAIARTQEVGNFLVYISCR